MSKAKKMRRLGNWITENRKTYSEIAELLGVTEAAIYHYVDGRNLPNALNLVKLSEITGIPCSELLPEESAA
jgi:transcriptional regulator with XRE-family HTH domain